MPGLTLEQLQQMGAKKVGGANIPPGVQNALPGASVASQMPSGQGLSQQQLQQMGANPIIQGIQSKDPAQSKATMNLAVQQSGSVLDGIEKFLGNIISSSAGVAGGIASAVFHPIKTVESMASIAKGGVEKLIPGEQADEKSFDTLVNYFKDRYGGVENIKKTMYDDPAGFLLDLSVVLGGTGGLAKISKIPELAKAGKIASKASQVVDPLRMAGKVAGKAIKPVGVGAKYLTGLTTRAGAENIEAVYQAGKEGGAAQKATLSGLRKKTTEASTVGKAKDALSNIEQSRSQEYIKARDVLIKQEGSKSYDISPIKTELTKQLENFKVSVKKGMLDFSQSPIRNTPSAIGDIKTIYEDVNGIGKKGKIKPTLDGLDDLQKGWKYTPLGGARAFVQALKSNVKNFLKDNVPGYSKLTSEYGEKSKLITSIKKDLSLSDKVSLDRGYNALLRAAKTDNELKVGLIKVLEENGAPNLLKEIAGKNLSEVLPQDIFRMAIDIGQIFAVFGGAINPLVLLDTLLTSPRIVGEMANFLGASARESEKVVDVLKRAKALGITKSAYYAQMANQ